MGQSLQLEIRDKIALITLSRPKTLHSLTFEIYAELESFFREGARDDRYRTVVLTGSGKGFCSGGDTARNESASSSLNNIPIA